MPKPIAADPNGTASRISAEAGVALIQGDTALAQQKHAEAGQILERRMKAVSRAREKHHLRFLAATQFYKGGHYQHASELAEKIDPKLLDERARELLPPFLKDVRERSSPGYLPRVRAKLNALWKAEDWKDVLVTLADHQFVLPPGGQAWLRGVCCRRLGNLKASALFLAQAFHDPDTKLFALESASYPIVLWAAHGRVAEASEYCRLLNAAMPHAVFCAAASFVEYSKLTQASEPERIEGSHAQLDVMEQAAKAADDLLSDIESGSLIRWVFALAAAAAAETCHKLLDNREIRFRELALRADRGNYLNLLADFARWESDQGSTLPGANTLLDRARKLDKKSTIEQNLPDFRAAA